MRLLKKINEFVSHLLNSTKGNQIRMKLFCGNCLFLGLLKVAILEGFMRK